MAQSIKKQEITKAQARKLTDRIKAAADELWSLLLEAHEGKAWKALGYKTWEAYIGAEFDMTRRHAYRLLDQGRVVRAIEDAAGENVTHGSQITERIARDIKPVLPEVTQEIRERVERGESPAQATYEVIEAKRVERKADKPEPPAKPKLSVAPDPEPDDDDGPTLDELIDELQEENKQLRAQVAAAEADDLVAEALKWQRMCEHAQRQQSEAMDKAHRAEKREAWNKRQLMRCGKAVGEDDPTKIAAAVEAMVRAAVAA